MSEEKKSKSVISELENILDTYMVKKAPFNLPPEVKKFIVKVAPYLVILSAIFVLPIIFAAIGLSALFAPFAMMGGYNVFVWGVGSSISFILTLIAFGMEILAVPGMFKRTKSAWNLVFYASIVSLISGIVSMNGIIGSIIGAIIGWYIIFQVKDQYKN